MNLLKINQINIEKIIIMKKKLAINCFVIATNNIYGIN